jgi:hypothetical protein
VALHRDVNKKIRSVHEFEKNKDILDFVVDVFGVAQRGFMNLPYVS